MAKKKEQEKMFYITEDEERIKEKIKEQTKYITINESSDFVPLMTKLFDNDSLIGVYDIRSERPATEKEKIKFLESMGINENDIISDSLLEEYIELLEQKASEDISNYNGEQVLALISDNNVAFFQYYATKIQPNLFDLYDESAQTSYAFKTLNYLMNLQMSEIERIGYDTFYNLEFNDSDSDFTRYFSIDTLKKIQKDFKNSDFKNSVYEKIMTNELEKIGERIKKDVENHKEFYEDRHKKYERIKELLVIVKEKYESRLNELRNTNKITKIETDIYKSIITDNLQYIDHRLHKKITDVKSNIKQPVDLVRINEKSKIKETPVNVELQIADTSLYGISLTRFDVIILNLIFNLYQAGNTKITPELVYKEYTGKTLNNMGPALKKEILNSIRKMTVSKIKIEIKPETNMTLNFGGEELKKFQSYEYVLPLKEDVLIYANGKKSNCFTFIYEPNYFAFSRGTRQIKTAKRELLALNTGSSLNEERMTIRDVLLYEFFRIQSTLGTKKENNKILFNTIYEKSGLFKELDNEMENATDSTVIKKLKSKKKTYIRRDNKVIYEILETWKKEGFIKSFKIYTSKENGRGIELIGVIKNINDRKK